MPVVTALRESDWNKDGTVVKVTNVTLDDGREAPGYDLPPGLEVGKPLPDGWEVTTAKSGKLYVKAPKPGRGGGFGGGGAAAFRNTKEGQAVEQERMDRRTALMQAVVAHGPIQSNQGSRVIADYADEFYAWLRKTAGGTASQPAAGVGPSLAPAPPSAGAPHAGTEGGRNAPSAMAASAGSVIGQPPAPGESAGSSNAPRPPAPADTSGGGQSSEGKAEACLHPNTVKTNPAGMPLPAGFERCADCGTTWRNT